MIRGAVSISRLLIAILSVACGADPTDVSREPALVEQARERFPQLIDLHQGVIARTCSPNRGVCHHSSSYPDLSTAANVLRALGAPCNVELPEPRLGWDDCERRADRAVTIDLSAELAWGDRIEAGVWRFELREAATVTATRSVRFERSSGDVAFDLLLGTDRERASIEIALEAGAHTATVSVRSSQASYRAAYDFALAGLVAGDPNRNGIFGAEIAGSRISSAALIEPGDISKSYLWRRITGTAPGSRMPLANQPLALDEYVAIACWIEGLKSGVPAPDAGIDYEHCEAASLPIEELVP